MGVKNIMESLQIMDKKKDAALAAEPQQPVAYRQKVQFYATEIWCYSEERRTGYNEPLYTKLVAAQYSDLVSDGGLDPRNASDVAAPQEEGWTDEDAAYLSDAINADISKDAARRNKPQ